MIKTVLLVVSASGEVRCGTRPRIGDDEVAFRIKLHFPDGWGKVQAQEIKLTIPDPPAALLDQPEDITPTSDVPAVRTLARNREEGSLDRVNPDRCDQTTGYHSTPHRGCLLRTVADAAPG